jgi:cobalt-precorrin-5B (C1)-methyltransferase
MTARWRAIISTIMETGRTLRRGWTTGACATAAAKAAYAALVGDGFPDPVEIVLPRGQQVAFTLAETSRGPDWATAAIVKDAGDDPDVTHGALIRATVFLAPPGSGVIFKAGAGVGTITRPGLPLPPGEPAINPVPRQMIRAAISQVAEVFATKGDVIVEISVPDGEALAKRTLNGRLGIVGGLSILGTTGIVVPFSCAAWIDSIHRGIDVARAAGLAHVAGATGSASEAAVQELHGLPDIALLEMGDFVGGMLKYLRTHPVPRITVAGGVAKMTKLAQGRLDLHSRRGTTDFQALAKLARECGASEDTASRIVTANTVAEAFAISNVPLGDAIAAGAWNVAAAALHPAPTELEIVVFDRNGTLLGRHGFASVHTAPPDLNLRR